MHSVPTPQLASVKPLTTYSEKLFQQDAWNGGLGPRYTGEGVDPETGEMFPPRHHNYPANFQLVLGIYEGVFGIRVSQGVEVNVNSPWDEASVSNLKILGHKVSVSWSKKAGLTVNVDAVDVIRNSPERKAQYPLGAVDSRPDVG
jgi:hypothetical protein